MTRYLRYHFFYQKEFKMIRLLVLLNIFVVMSFAYVRAPYLYLKPQTFQTNINYVGTTLDQSNDPDYQASFAALFRFESIIFGIKPTLVSISSTSYSQTLYQFIWVIADDMSVSGLTVGSQLGAYSLNQNSTLQSSRFETYDIDYALTNRVSLLDFPIYFVASHLYSPSEASIDNILTFGWQYQSNRYFLEADISAAQYYVGVESYFTPNHFFRLALNISSDQKISDDSVFYPAISMGVSLTDVFGARPKPAPKQPLDIDEDSFAKLEKGLLAFQSNNFEAAASNYEQVAEKYPEFVLAYVRLGNSYYKLNQMALAKKAWTHALTLDPTNDDLFMALTRLKNKDASIQEFIQGN